MYRKDKSKKPICILSLVVLENPNGEIDQDNIKKIYEIKFHPDDWKFEQREGSQEIAGDPHSKVEKIGLKECVCREQDLERQPATAEARQQASGLAEAADRNLRELLREAGHNPLITIAYEASQAAIFPMASVRRAFFLLP